METLRIEIPFKKQEFLESQKIKWNYLWKNYILKIMVWLIAAILLLIVGLLVRKDGEPYNVFMFISALFLLNAILLWQSNFFSHRNQVKQTKKFAEKYESIGMINVYEFTDDSIKYWDYEKHFKLNWDIFQYYTIYKGYLILFAGEMLVDILTFKLVETGDEAIQYNKILDFVKNKLRPKHF
ncbi:MAG: hypothetical protein WCR12_03000 [Dysgonamonadaceae bacterium]